MRKLLTFLLTLALLFAAGLCQPLSTQEVWVEDGIALSPTAVVEWGYEYLSAEEVALYLYAFAQLPPNYLTKAEARAWGWQSSKGNLWDLGEGLCIGGDEFGNREGLLPEEEGRVYYECDVDYAGGFREASRLVFSSDGYIYYTQDHYASFELLYDSFFDPYAVYPPKEAADAGTESGDWQ